MIQLLMSLALLAQQPAKADSYAIRRTLQLDTAVTNPRDIVAKAWEDAKALETIDPSIPQFSRYVWIPDWIEPASGFAQVSLVSNSTFARSNNIIQPTSVADGKLVRIDLTKLASKEEQLAEIVGLYEKLADHDSFFNVKVNLVGDVAIVDPNQGPNSGDAVEMMLNSGAWVPAVFKSRDGDKITTEYKGTSYPTQPQWVKWKGKLLSEKPAAQPAHTEQVFAAAPYLNPEGAELFRVTHSSVPIMRLDEWVAFTFSTVNGGLYYALTGIKANLLDTIKEFAGNDAAQKVARSSAVMRQAQEESRRTGEGLAKVAGRLDPELAKSKALIQTSEVTGRQRVVAFFFGTGTSPTSGVQLVAVTFDIAEDNTDPNSDPLRHASVFETYNGGEAIFAMPNGLLAYVVFDADDKVIASVPDKVAHDFRARDVRSNVATTRVFSGVSCANCHDALERNWGWQPVVNDLNDTVRGLGKILDDRGRRSSLEALQTLTAQYSATTLDLKAMLDQARLPYQYRASLATNHATTRETIAGLADSYWGYWYDRVTPEVAARDLGQSLSAEKAQLFLLRAIDPERSKDLESFLQEDGFLMRLKDGKHGTPAQWRTIYQSVAERTFFKPAEAEGALK